ncbi:MAG: 2-(1,2-epoxy-1,2-dihydrophenyl)acetyl-CoA isomerase [Chloroflexi bacterium]|nr:2-(1,2-epoxy-1,2-dihydrophenyl)acetyl-CoA isomerase [Chloroflexota bacterium]
MAYSTLLCEKTDGVATITFNRPDKSNAFDDALIAETIDALKDIERDADVRAIILTGAGKNFCAGQDLSPLLKFYQSGQPIPFGEHVRKSYNVIVAKIRTIEKPFIAAINGAAAGAGFGIACACDLRHASEHAKLRMAFVGIALAPDSAASFLLPRLIGLGRALEMAITNEPVDAAKALQIGLVNRVFSADELMPKTHEFARQLSRAPTRAIGLTKRAFNRALDCDLETALDYEATMQEIAGRTRDHREGVQAFTEKRAPKFSGQ